MRNFKKVVAGLLAVLMLALSVNVSFAAEEYSDAEAVVVAKVNAAGIMTGTDKGFEPSKSLTRAEAAAIIVRMKGISESAVKAMAGTTLFADVPASHWASGYTNQASNLGIVKGVSATQFAPEREVTIAEFVTMAIRALGAGQLVDAEGTWPTNYVNFANEEKILDNVNGIYTAAATRLQAATIVANTLKTVMWEKSGVKTNGEITWQKSTTKDNILEDVLELEEVDDITPLKVNYKDSKIYVGDDEDSNEIWIKVSKDFDLASIKVGTVYAGYYDADEEELLGLWIDEDSKIKTVEFTEIKAYTADKSIKVVVDGEEVKYDVKNGAVIYKNGELNAIAPSENIFGTLQISKDEVVKVYAEEYTTVGLVKETTDTRIKFDDITADDDYTVASTALKIDDDHTYFVTKDGSSIDVTDIEEDDVLFFYGDETSKVYHIDVVTDSKEGKVTASGSNYIKLDGEKLNKITGFTIAVDSEVEVFFNKAEKIVAYKTIDGTSEYAVISSIEFVKNNKDEVKAQVVLTYTDGTKSDALEVNTKADDGSKLDGINGNASEKNYLVTTDKTDLKDINAVILNDDATKLAVSMLGQLVDYEIDGSKVVIKDFAALSTGSDISTETGVKYVAGASKKYFDGAANYYLTDSTKVLAVREDKDKDYRAKVVVLDADELETTSGLTVTFVLDKNGKVKVALINELVKKVDKGQTDGNWAIVTSWSDQLGKDADYDREITVINNEGKEAYYYADNSIVSGKSPLTLWGELTVSGEEITEIEANAADGYGMPSFTGTSIFKEEDGIIYLCTDDAEAENFVLGNKVVYILLNEAGDYEVADEDDLDFADKIDDDEFDDEDASVILNIYTYEEETDAPEVIAIVFTNVRP